MWDTETASPDRQLPTWNQSLQANKEAERLSAARFAGGCRRGEPLRSAQGLLERLPVVWAKMRPRHLTWTQSFEAVGREVQVVSRGSRCPGSWGSINAGGAEGVEATCSFCSCQGTLFPPGNILHSLHVKIILSREKCAYCLIKKWEYWFVSLLFLRLCHPHEQSILTIQTKTKSPGQNRILTFLR